MTVKLNESMPKLQCGFESVKCINYVIHFCVSLLVCWCFIAQYATTVNTVEGHKAVLKRLPIRKNVS